MRKKFAVGSWQLAVKDKNPKTLLARSLLPTANCLLQTPLIIGHRGAAAVTPENTLVSFERALADGADGIEFDVRLAGDGVPVVIHDPTLRRTALKSGRIASFSSTELSEMDAGTWFNLRYPARAHPLYAEATIPTLAAVFASLRKSDALLYVEMKCGARDRSALAAEVVNLVRAHRIAARVRVESFDLAAITEIKRLDANLRTAALFDRRLSRPAPSARKMIERAILCGAEEIALHHSLATRRTVAEATLRGLETVVWTADNPAWIARAIKLGVRAIITNDPARLIEKGRFSDGR
ncbi:MAG: glycerophosphoryl diester phosphodiesterase [Acidobacteriota bacterium]|jgi:glycerophosphoryl diester phosphodiesterase|nr:glycerophosphoryl diester phosphodiesterase [Acidobacteriota bacterium]